MAEQRAEHHEIRWGGLAGLGYAALALVGYFLPGTGAPRVDDSTASIVSFFTDNRAMVLTQAFLFGAAAALLVWFAAAIAQLLRDRLAGSDLPGAFFGGMILVAAIMLIGAGLYGNIAYRGGNPAATVAAFDLTQLMFGMLGLAAAVPFTALALGIHRAGVFPQWVGWLAALCALLGVAGALFIGRTAGVFVPGGPLVGLIPFVAFALLVIVAGLYMVREHLPTVTPTPHALGHA